MAAVTILGPNLGRGAKAEFHVHAAGCADIARDLAKFGPAETSTLEYASRLDVARDWFDFVENPEDSLGEFYFAPCTKEALR